MGRSVCWSSTMQACILSTSGLSSKEKGYVKSTISTMGGKYTDDLTHNVTHLILQRVGSAKHQVAIQCNIPCVELQWLVDCKAQNCLLNSSVYKVRTFLGLNVSVTGESILPEERYELQRLIEAGGGSFSKQMTGGECTHLIAADAKGDKWNLALKYHKVTKIVNKNWIYDCSLKESWLNEIDYPVVAQEQSNGYVASANTKDAAKSNLQVDPIMHSARGLVLDKKTSAVQDASLVLSEYTDWISSRTALDLSKSFHNELFYIVGFTNQITDGIMGMILVGGGRRVFRLSSKATRIIVGEGAEPSLVDSIKRHPFGARCMKVTWLLYKLKCSAAGAVAGQEAPPKTCAPDICSVLPAEAVLGAPSRAQAHNWLLSQQDHYEDSFQSSWAPGLAPSVSWNPLRAARNSQSEFSQNPRGELTQAFTANFSRRSLEPVRTAAFNGKRFPADSQVVHFDDGVPYSSGCDAR